MMEIPAWKAGLCMASLVLWALGYVSKEVDLLGSNVDKLLLSRLVLWIKMFVEPN